MREARNFIVEWVVYDVGLEELRKMSCRLLDTKKSMEKSRRTYTYVTRACLS
jgi:hypothetical protein